MSREPEAALSQEQRGSSGPIGTAGIGPCETPSTPCRVGAGHAKCASGDAGSPPPPATRLSRVTPRPTKWLWRNWLPVGEIVVAEGMGGVSKSTIAIDWMARLTTGRPMPDGARPREPIEILYLTEEDDPDTVVLPRLIAAGGDADMVHYWTDPFVLPGDKPALANYVTANPAIRLVFIDPLYSHVDTTKVKSQDDAIMRQLVMAPLKDIATSINGAVLVARHFNKSTGQELSQRGSGSYGGISGRARVVMAVIKDPDDLEGGGRLIGITKQNLGLQPKPLRFRVMSEILDLPGFSAEDTLPSIEWRGNYPDSLEIAEYRLRRAQQDAAKKSHDDLDELVTEMIADSPMPAKMVEQAVLDAGFTKSALRTARKRLGLASGPIVPNGEWYLRLPPKRPLQ
jgi:hypothetical protein